MLIQDHASAGLKALTEEYSQRFAPASTIERFLVETLAISEWRSRRYMRTEAAIWEHSPDAFEGKAGKDLDRLHRLADSAQRAFSAALKQLMAMQAARAPKPGVAPASPSSGLFVVPKRSHKQR
jgi:hypothetical protein